jgi:6-pyruvoyltetrahydropterin/6-carboxytetrahydropterin synthase
MYKDKAVAVRQASRVGTKGGLAVPAASSLFVEDDSLHFEYGHCLPRSSKCSVIHGHSSRVSVELFGERRRDGMILDFGAAKKIVKKVLKDFDHKFIISKKYARVDSDRCFVAFDGRSGRIEMNIPSEQAVILSGEATSENIATEVSRELLEKLPPQVMAVKAFFFEGANKGASYFRVRSD